MENNNPETKEDLFEQYKKETRNRVSDYNVPNKKENPPVQKLPPNNFIPKSYPNPKKPSKEKKPNSEDKYYNLIKHSLIGAGAIALVFAFLVYNGYFISECPEQNCPEIPTCPSMNLSCPEQNCPDIEIPSCNNTCNFPNKLEIEVTNESQ